MFVVLQGAPPGYHDVNYAQIVQTMTGCLQPVCHLFVKFFMFLYLSSFERLSFERLLQS